MKNVFTHGFRIFTKPKSYFPAFILPLETYRDETRKQLKGPPPQKKEKKRRMIKIKGVSIIAIIHINPCILYF